MCFLIPLLSGSDQGTQLLSYMKFLPIVCIYLLIYSDGMCNTGHFVICSQGIVC